MSEWVSSAIAAVGSMDPTTGALALMAGVVVSTVSVVITTSPFNFAFGAMYGVFLGGLLMCVACTLGSIVNFLLGRFVFSAWARRKLQESPTLSALEGLLQQSAFSIIFLARLSPVFPMALFGYCVGATNVNLVTYSASTFAGLLPGCILYAWIGQAAGNGGWSSVISISISILSTVAISIRAKQLVDEALSKSASTQKANE